MTKWGRKLRGVEHKFHTGLSHHVQENTRFQEEQRRFAVDGTVYRWYVTVAQYKYAMSNASIGFVMCCKRDHMGVKQGCIQHGHFQNDGEHGACRVLEFEFNPLP